LVAFTFSLANGPFLQEVLGFQLNMREEMGISIYLPIWYRDDLFLYKNIKRLFILCIAQTFIVSAIMPHVLDKNS